MLINLSSLYPWRSRLAVLYFCFLVPHNPGGPSFPLQKITYLLTDKGSHRGHSRLRGAHLEQSSLCVSYVNKEKYPQPLESDPYLQVGRVRSELNCRTTSWRMTGIWGERSLADTGNGCGTLTSQASCSGNKNRPSQRCSHSTGPCRKGRRRRMKWKKKMYGLIFIDPQGKPAVGYAMLQQEQFGLEISFTR